MSKALSTILAIETSTDLCCVGLQKAGVVHSDSREGARTHARIIMQQIDDVLEGAGALMEDVDGIAVGCGPGSFTGVRIALAVGQGLGSGLSVPLLCVSSLRVQAQCVLDAHPQLDAVHIAQDARLGEVYAGHYGRDNSGLAYPLSADTLEKPEALLSHLGGYVCGSALAEFDDLRAAVTSAGITVLDTVPIDARALLRIGLAAPVEDWRKAELAQPAYLRDRVAHKSAG